MNNYFVSVFLGLILLFSSSSSSVLPISANPNNFPPYHWNSPYSQQVQSPPTPPLKSGRTFASVALVNTTFLVFGGCTGENSTNCRGVGSSEFATEIEAFDANTGERVTDFSSTLGISSSILPSAPRGWLGRHAVATVNQQIYIMHMCTIYPSSNIPDNLTDEDKSFYTQTFTIPTAITSPPETAFNISAFPFALANASCTINQDSILVIGGVNLETKRINDNMYVYDTVQQNGWQVVTAWNGNPISVPVQQAAVTGDSGSVYVAGGLDSNGDASPSCYRFVLWTNLPSFMCDTELTNIPTKFLPTTKTTIGGGASLLESGLDHSLHVFGGNLMYFYQGSQKMAILPGQADPSVPVYWNTDAVTFVPPAIEPVADHGNLVNCTTSEDFEHSGGAMYSATVMTNTTGSILFFFKIGGQQNVKCLEYYTTTTTTTTTTSTTTTTTTTTEAPTTTSTTSTTTTSTEVPPPPVSTTTTTSLSALPLQQQRGDHHHELGNYRQFNYTIASDRVYIAKSSHSRPAPLVPSNGHISTIFRLTVNTSIDQEIISQCNVTSQPCMWRVANSYVCMGDDDASNHWYFNTGGVTILRITENQFPLYVCFQDANYPPIDATCLTRAKQQTRTSYDILNRIGPILSTLGDSPIPTTTPAPPNATTGGPTIIPNPPLLSEGAIIGIVVAAACFFLVVLLAWSKRLRSEDLSSAAAIVRDSRYEFLETLGEGSFGQVVRVRRRADDEIFALKYIEIPTSREMHEALHEFEITRQLQNFPNIITIHDLFLNFELDSNLRRSTRRSSNFGSQRNDENAPLLAQNSFASRRRSGSNLEAPGHGGGTSSSDLQRPKRVLCFVMDYHPDGDLRRMILDRYGGEDQKAPEPLLSHIALQLLRTLDFIHGKGIVHRDIKPENILMARPSSSSSKTYGEGAPSEMFQKVVVSDFGLAKIMEMNTDGIMYAGSMAFSAPEQLKYLQYFINPPSEQGPSFQLPTGAAKKDHHLGSNNSNNNTNNNSPALRASSSSSTTAAIPVPKNLSAQQLGSGSTSVSLATQEQFSPKEQEEKNPTYQPPSVGGPDGDDEREKEDDKKKNNQKEEDSGSNDAQEAEEDHLDPAEAAVRNRSNVNSSTHLDTNNGYGTATSPLLSSSSPAPSHMPSPKNTKPPIPAAPADVWSLGCVLYACMTRKLTPTRGVRELAKELNDKFGGNEEDFDKHLTRELTGLKYSAAFVSLVVAMLKGDPSERIAPSVALQYFRKSIKDHTYYVSSRAAQSSSSSKNQQ